MMKSTESDQSAHAAELTDFQVSLDLSRVYVKGGGVRSPSVRGQKCMRILSWNIGRGHKPDRIAETLARIQPDVACLQEVDWGNRRTNSVDVLEYIAERLGMLGFFGIEFLEICSPLRPEKLAGGGATGNAVLTRFEPTTVFTVNLPASVNWHPGAQNADLSKLARRSLRQERRIGERSAICAELALNGLQLLISSVHLEDKAGGVQGRWAQYMATVKGMAARRDSPVTSVIAGDFNTFDCRLARLVTKDRDSTALAKPAGVTEAAWWKSELLPRTGFADPFAPTEWTFSLPPLFRAKLDWITTNTQRVQQYGIGPFSSSDHRPIWIDLEIPE
jgi:endonuclease/exonuclease/phosphatase family metal-dependent hydrolase